jgi:hypothetical protein
VKYSVWPDSNLNRIARETTELHLVRPLSFKKIRLFCEKRPIQKISCSPSCFQRIKPKTRNWLEEKGIGIEIQGKRGRPLKTSLPKMVVVVELAKDHRSYREIEKNLHVPKSTAHYLVKYAQRDRVKKNGSTVFLE